MAINEINVTKARVHNLKEVSVKIPKNTFSVITGPSGSGKSSLAFDTIYVEGQRRYIESLSSYARQFLGQFSPPDVESITGLSPAIAIDQKTSSKNPRSTVGTVTEIYDYLRVLFARVGTLFDPTSGDEIKSYTAPQIVRELLELPQKSKIHILAPIQSAKGEQIQKEISKFLTIGFSRARLNGEIILLDDDIQIKKNEIYNFEIVIDRLLIKDGITKRITDSIEHALKLGNGVIGIIVDEDEYRQYSEKNMSPVTGEVFPDLEPRLFSFNSPLGACGTCNGLGESKVFDLSLMITDENISIRDGAISSLSKRNQFLYRMVECIAKTEGVDLDSPLKKLPKKFQKILFEGTNRVYNYKFSSENSNFEFSKSFPGLIRWLDKKYRETSSDRVRKSLEEYMKINTCPTCQGLRLNQIALSTKVADRNIMEICSLSIIDAYSFTKKIKLKGEKALIAEKLLKEINGRLGFMNNVGLGYLNLNRAAMSLSGGESQRIRLATQIGSALSGVLYVLDEPSIGLHQRDNTKLIQTLKTLRDLGNTVLVVEHDEETMMESDYIIDLGPGAGVHGGEIVAHGKSSTFLKSSKSLTAKYLRGDIKIETPAERRVLSQNIKLKKANCNNLNNLDVTVPLGGLVCITGVSGSGKSTLVHEVLVPACKTYLSRANRNIYEKTNYHSITGLTGIKSIIELDQSPIGRTPHSNPATYTGLFDEIRKLFSKTPESQIRGYKQGRFSFNVKGGRCEACEGNGVNKIEMHFLPDVYITCAECNGSRYNSETLSVLYKGQNIADVLNMTIEECYDFFKNHPRMERILGTLRAVGLDYIKLGQPATTLSGGEAQRMKLARELSKRTKGHCLYVLDEPTTGLHFQDIKVLLEALNKLINQGNSVLVIEHNLDVIKTADHIIDLGPEGGDGGGNIVATGTPEDVARNKKKLYRKISQESASMLTRVLNLHDDILKEFTTLKNLNCDRIVVESPKVIQKALDSGFIPDKILVDENLIDLIPEKIIHNCSVYVTTKEILRQSTGARHHQGILLSGNRPAYAPLISMKGGSICIIEGVTSPENVGSIVRSCAAFGIRNLIFDSKSVNPFLRRSIRVSMGNIFYMKVHKSKNITDTLVTLKDYSYKIFSTSADDNRAVNISEIEKNKRFAFIIGSEGHGISEDLKKESDTIIKIPIDNDVAHLNASVAAAIVAYELSK